MNNPTHKSKSRDKKCENCFQYTEVYRRHCKYCGAEMPKTRRKLTLIEKIKRFLGI